MKKLFYLFAMALPLAFYVSSCDDDDDLPDVEMNVAFSGGKVVDGTVYVVQGDTLTIDSVTVTNLEKGKTAVITSATYYWDGACLGTAVVQPYRFQIVTTESTPVGDHLLQIETPVLAVDKSAAVGVTSYTVQVVPDSLDIPGEAVNDPVVQAPNFAVQ